MSCLISFEANPFASVGEAAGSIIEDPNFPLAIFGRVRDVEVETDSDGVVSFRCVTFSRAEVGDLMKYEIPGWGDDARFPVPMFMALDERQQLLPVYTYPEVNTILGQLREEWMAGNSAKMHPASPGWHAMLMRLSDHRADLQEGRHL